MYRVILNFSIISKRFTLVLTTQAVVADWETWWVSEPIAANRAVVWGPNSQ